MPCCCSKRAKRPPRTPSCGRSRSHTAAASSSSAWAYGSSLHGDADLAHSRLAARPFRPHRHHGRRGRPAGARLRRRLGAPRDSASRARARRTPAWTSVRYGTRVTSIAHERLGAHRVRERQTAAEMLASIVLIADGAAHVGGRRSARDRLRAERASPRSSRPNAPRTHGTAYERFTPDGPLALLPYEPRLRAGVDARAARGRAHCATHRPMRSSTGCRRASASAPAASPRSAARAAHPLRLRVAEQSSRGPRGAHRQRGPGAAPGRGPGFQSRVCATRGSSRSRCGAAARRTMQCSTAYLARRRIDRAGGIAFTHALVKIFSNDGFPLALARGAGLAHPRLPAACEGFRGAAHGLRRARLKHFDHACRRSRARAKPRKVPIVPNAFPQSLGRFDTRTHVTCTCRTRTTSGISLFLALRVPITMTPFP